MVGRLGFYKRIGWLFGHGLANKVQKKLNFAGLEVGPYDWVGFVVVFVFLVSLLVFSLSEIFFNLEYSILLAIAGAIITFSSLVISVDMIIDKRRKFVESILPDILSIISINLSGGLTLEESLNATAKPEFGFFSKNILMMAKRLHTGKTFKEAADKMKEEVYSPILYRILDLTNEGIMSGGKIGPILEESADSLRKMALLEKEVNASVTSYFWFIVIASAIAAPLLFGSVFFLEKILSGLMPHTQVAYYKFRPKVMPAEEILQYFLINLGIIGIFGGILAGIIKGGKEKYGLKYTPIILTLSLIVFFSITFVLSHFIGNFK